RTSHPDELRATGVVFIIVTWCSPVQMCLLPLVGAIAAENCAIISLSEFIAHTSLLLHRLVPLYLDNVSVPVDRDFNKPVEEITSVCICLGGSHSKYFQECIDEGSTNPGISCRPGSYPCHLILGNKNPCYVDQHYDIAITTQRIAWAQFHNAGKSLVAPDFLLCHVDIKERLLEALKTCITRFYGCDESHSFGRIVNMEVFNHTIDVLWRSGKVAVGGQIIETEKYIGKLNLYLNEANRWSHISNHLQVTESDPILQQDIFSLVLTVLSINDMERPPYKDRNLSLMTWARTLSQRSQGWCQIL
uniref:Aldehyde dehydrogenase 3 family, member B2 n=1 Tax=Cynoglossus semilaevis TaxID=244447 RepID=A0A3P8W507_CYNSE